MSLLRSLLTSTFFIASPLYAASPDSCSALIGSCEYYTCIENERLSCGAVGYPIAYGLNYCEKLSDLEFSPARTALGARTFPADGNLWRDEVRSCLQEEMETFFQSSEDLSCESLKAFAFESHPRCYTQSISFCELTVESVVKVGLTISTQDFFTAESLAQVGTTARICSEQIGLRMRRETNPLVRLNLLKYKVIWNSITRDPSRFQDELESMEGPSDHW